MLEKFLPKMFLIFLAIIPFSSGNLILDKSSTILSSKCAAAFLEKYFVSGDSHKGSLLSVLLENVDSDLENDFLREINSNPGKWSIQVEVFPTKSHRNL
uniref:Uncharacterized protein n=1 Tax=Megaselia scalaris TaxID=36166 RepID=T1GQW5_MEGSC